MNDFKVSTKLILVTLCIAVAIVLWLNSDNLLQAASNAGWIASPPDQHPQNLYLALPQFNGKVVHSSLIQYEFSPSGKWPENGRKIFGDIWLQVDNGGNPVRFHGLYVFEDGSFHQEIIENADTNTLIMPSKYVQRPPNEKGPPPLCVTRSIPTNSQNFKQLLPLFMNRNVLEQQGFRAQGLVKLSRSLPNTQLLPGIQPAFVLKPDATVSRLTQEQRSDQNKVTRTIELNSNGHVVFTQSVITNQKNEVINDFQMTFGELVAYKSEDVTPLVFERSPKSREACND